MDHKQELPTKILIVGEKCSGKTSIVQTFKEYDFTGSASTTNTKVTDDKSGKRNESGNNKSKGKMHVGVNQDFSLKILQIDGQKVRIQLWDQGSHMGASATFQPLYIRNISGCIIVANSTNYKSLERAQRWKDYFDKKTKIPNEPNVPACLFINHDDLERSAQIIQQFPFQSMDGQGATTPNNNVSGGKFKDVSDTDILSANRAMEDDEFHSPERLDARHDVQQRNNSNMGQRKNQTPQNQQLTSNKLQYQDKFVNQYMQKYKTCVDHENIPRFEKIANIDSAGFFGTYHVCMGQPETICEAFENFLQRILSEKQRRRYDSSVSKLFADDTLRNRTCICRDLMEHYNSDDQGQVFLYNDQKGAHENEKEFRQHHPHCPMRRSTEKGGGKGSTYYSSENDSIVLRRLSKRRFDNQNRNGYQQQSGNQQSGSCC